jgi:DNA-binding transcriptional LysR family regulator
MDLKHLRTFVAVAENGTVSRAAARLAIAQPALSRQIIDLEAELGITLFDRVSRRLKLTCEGEQLLARSRALLGYASSLADHAQALKHGDSGVLNVVASPQMIENVFSSFLRHYAKRYPGVRIQLIEGFGDNVLTMVERGDAQFGVIVNEAVPSGAEHFGAKLLVPLTYVAAHIASLAPGRGPDIEIRNLAPLRLLVLDSRHLHRKTFDAACRIARTKPNVVFECSSPHTLLSLAEAGHGIAIVPSNVLLQRYALKALRITHQRRALSAPLSLFWDRRRVLPRYADDFGEMLADHAKHVILERHTRRPRAIGRR